MEALSENQLCAVSEVVVSYRPAVKPSLRPVIKCSEDAYNILMGFWNHDKIQLTEQFCLILLNVRHRVLGVIELSSGSYDATFADIKMIFSIALKACANSIIVAHNHPSGECSPSSNDVKLTERLVEAGKILTIKVDDHLIVTTDGYYSFADKGLIY